MSKLPPSGRLLLLGLDAGEWTLIQRWANEGLLPTFRRLLDEGASGELCSTAAQFLDLAPTFLAAAGVKPPEDLDGRPLPYFSAPVLDRGEFSAR